MVNDKNRLIEFIEKYKNYTYYKDLSYKEINIFLDEIYKIRPIILNIINNYFTKDPIGKSWMNNKKIEINSTHYKEEVFIIKIDPYTPTIEILKKKSEIDKPCYIKSKLLPWFIDNFIIINVHTHPFYCFYNSLEKSPLIKMYVDKKLDNKEFIFFYSLPSYIDIKTFLKANLLYYNFELILSSEDLCFYSCNKLLIQQMIINPEREKLIYLAGKNVNNFIIETIFSTKPKNTILENTKKKFLNIIQKLEYEQYNIGITIDIIEL